MIGNSPCGCDEIVTLVNPFMNLVRSVTSTHERTPRRSPRLPVKLSALLHPGENQAAVPVALRNISVGGASMTSHVRLRQNDRVLLTLQLGPNVKLDVQARVVHAGEKGTGFRCQYGLKFFNLTQEAYRVLAAFIHDPKNGWQFDTPPPPWEAKRA